MEIEDILQKLKGNDRRSIGRVREVVMEVLNNPSLFNAIFEGMLSDDPVLRMRCADAVEKITSKCPELLQPYKKIFIQKLARIGQQEVRWHVAQMFSRLELNRLERRSVVKILINYLKDESRIVKTFSMQALADIAKVDTSFRSRIIAIIEELTDSGSPAMKSRGLKLLEELKR
jgi:hypothetical protein